MPVTWCNLHCHSVKLHYRRRKHDGEKWKTVKIQLINVFDRTPSYCMTL